VNDEKKRKKKVKKKTIKKKITPLHLAESSGNNRCMNILLEYMAKSDANASETISDILHKMID
jgi:hypothetical protein